MKARRTPVVAGLSVVGVSAALAVAANVGRDHSHSPQRVVHTYGNYGQSLETAKKTAVQLAANSFSVPSVTGVELARVVKDLGPHQLGAAADSVVVTDYQVVVLHYWSTKPATAPVIIRIPGGVIGTSEHLVEDAPRIRVGDEVLVWQQTEPATSLAGASSATVIAVPSVNGLAYVSNNSIDWAGKTATLPAIMTALNEAASGRAGPRTLMRETERYLRTRAKTGRDLAVRMNELPLATH